MKCLRVKHLMFCETAVASALLNFVLLQFSSVKNQLKKFHQMFKSFMTQSSTHLVRTIKSLIDFLITYT